MEHLKKLEPQVCVDRHEALPEAPTDLSLHPNSPGYRLILNNVLFPAAKKRELKT